MSNMCTCHIDQDNCLYCLYYTPMERERDYWKQRALAAEAQLGINLPFATEKLTSKQQRVFEQIEQYFLEHHEEPTIRQMLELTGLKSTSSAFRYIEALERKGYIERRGKQGFKLLVRSEVKCGM